jgi:hypothetical protein
MPNTDTYTCLEVCTDALRKIGVVAADEQAQADEIESAGRALNRMLKAWQGRGYNLWAVSAESVTATTDAEHSLTDARPLEIQSIRVKRGGTEIPMYRMNREQYDMLPNKATTGIPTQFYFNRQRDAATFLVWPLFPSVTTETFEVTYIRELNDVVLTDQVDVPSEWYDATIYGLAARLLDDYTISNPMLVQRAEEELRLALAYDREGSVYFCGDGY